LQIRVQRLCWVCSFWKDYVIGPRIANRSDMATGHENKTLDGRESPKARDYVIGPRLGNRSGMPTGHENKTPDGQESPKAREGSISFSRNKNYINRKLLHHRCYNKRD